MSGSVDDRVVGLRFENSRFASAINSTLGLLDRLKRSLTFGGKKNGVDEMQQSVNRFSMGGMGNAIQTVTAKFSALQAAGIAALATLTSRAVSAGASMIKSLTIAPVMQGFQEYENGLNSVQTILANTEASGATLKDVNAALLELNHYADKTIYNFGEMTRNIGTFTAAGVDLKTATSSIKGIANLAALSGSNSEQASTAMYQLSQAISAGRVGLQDWNSVVNAGMGGAVFQRALAKTAVAMGEIDASALKLSGKMKNVTINGKSFRESIMAKPGQQSWLSGKVLTNTLKQFSGDLTDAQLKAQGFNQEQIKDIRQMAKTATNAATKVKTFSQLIDTMKEAVGSGWAQSFQTLLGDFGEAKTLFTGISDYFGKIIGDSANARNKLLGDWKKMGGRTQLLEGIKAAWQGILSILKPIQEAYRRIFPATTARQLFEMTKNFRAFAERIKIGGETADKLKRTFQGVFAVFSIVKHIVGQVFGVFTSLFGGLAKGSGGFLNLTAKIGDFLVAVDRAIVDGGALNGFFEGLKNVIKAPLQALSQITDALFGGIGGFDLKSFDGIAAGMRNMGQSFANATAGGVDLTDILDKIKNGLQKVRDFLAPFVDKVKEAFGQVGDVISAAFTGQNVGNVLQALQTGLLAGILLAIKRFFSNGINVDIGSGFLGNLSETFETLTGTMKAMQQQIQAKTLLKIAAAIGIITASVIALALIDPEKLKSGMTALGIGFAQLLGAMAILVKITGSAGIAKVPAMATGLMLLASAMLVLSGAVAILATMDTAALQRGLLAIGALLAMVSATALVLTRASGGMIRASIGITALAVALNLMAGAVKLFSLMNWSELARGMAGVAAALVVISVTMRTMPKGMLASAAGILILSAALQTMALAIKAFAGLDLMTMVRGLGGIAAALVTIGLAMRAMPKGMLAQAAALIVLAGALNIMATAVNKLGSTNYETLGKGLVSLGILIGGLVVALRFMQGAIGGAVAMTVAAAAIMVLATALKTIGQLDWKQLIIGMTGIIGTFAGLALVGTLASGASLPILALAAALLALGAALALIGAGIYLAGKGLGYFIKAGSQGIKILMDAITQFIEKIPDMVVGLVKGLIEAVKVIGQNAPGLIGAFAKIIGALVDAIIKVLPKIVLLISKLVDAMIKVLIDNVPKIADAAFKLIIALLQSLTKNLPRLTKAGADAVVAFLKGLGENIGPMVDAAFKFIVKFLNAIADAIDQHLPEILEAAGRIGKALVTGLLKGIGSLLGWIWDGILGFFSWLWDKILGFFGIHSPSTKMAEVGVNLIKGLWQGITSMASWVWSMISGFFSWLWDKITGAISGAISIGKTIISNIWSGITSVASTLFNAGKWVISKIWNGITSLVSTLLSAGRWIINRVWNGITSLVSTIFNAGKWVVGKIWSGITAVASTLFNAGKWVIGKIWSGITTVASTVFNAGKWVIGKIWGGITSAVSTIFNAGKWVIGKIWSGITTVASTLLGAGKWVINKIWSGIKSLASTIWNAGKWAAQKVWDGVKALGGGLLSAGKWVADKVIGGIKNALFGFSDVGGQMAQGVIEGWKAKRQAFLDEVERTMDTATDKANKSLGIQSPSRVFMKIGAFTVAGLVKGLRDNQPSVDNAINRLGKSMILRPDLMPDADFNPKITPVLDLTMVNREANKLADLFTGGAISINIAARTADEMEARRNVQNGSETFDANPARNAPEHVEFNQYNTSPKPLNAADIRRDTKSLLALAKGGTNV